MITALEDAIISKSKLMMSGLRDLLPPVELLEIADVG